MIGCSTQSAFQDKYIKACTIVLWVQCPVETIFVKCKADINFIVNGYREEVGALERAALLWAVKGEVGVSLFTGQQVGRSASGFP